jgi:hypothetical protein
MALPLSAQNKAEARIAGTAPVPEEIRFEAGNVTLAGLLRLPASTPPHPAVVLVAGSLPTAKEDERLAGVAEAFLAEGFAVLTTDSRGTGASQGEFDTASLELLADDAMAAVAVLRRRPEVRAEGVGLWGVSQGASWVGPLAAKGASAAFLVAVSGPLVSPETHVHRFLDGRLRSTHGLDEAEIARVANARRAVWSYYATGQGYERASAAVAALLNEPWFASAGIPPKVIVPSELKELPARTRTFLAQKDFDPLAAISELRCPLLAVYGAEDGQLAVGDHVDTLRALRKSQEARITVELLSGLDHDLRPVPGQTLSPIARHPFATMARWAAHQVTLHGKGTGGGPAGLQATRSHSQSGLSHL